MRAWGVLLIVLLCGGVLFGESLQGVQVSDMDQKANPCTDFYDYANGAWRASNPIPASMDRWSRRWQAGESNKEKVKTILEESAAKTGQPKGSITQLTGDFYAACMDMATINKLGTKPLEPWLADVDAVKDRQGLVKMIGRMERVGINVPFGMAPLPDPHNPSDMIADIGAGGLGLPDRDY
jgi:endothelin-converting enzyme/putative endopeptidase